MLYFCLSYLCLASLFNFYLYIFTYIILLPGITITCVSHIRCSALAMLLSAEKNFFVMLWPCCCRSNNLLITAMCDVMLWLCCCWQHLITYLSKYALFDIYLILWSIFVNIYLLSTVWLLDQNRRRSQHHLLTMTIFWLVSVQQLHLPHHQTLRLKQ